MFKDKPNLSLLENIGFVYHSQMYQMPGLNQMKIYHQPYTNFIKIKGSIPYLVNKQNFVFDEPEFLLGIELLQDTLEIDLWNCSVNAFEYGRILECEQKADLVLSNHFKLKGTETIIYKHGRYFTNRAFALKLYNAKKRIIQQLKKAERDYLKGEGYYNPDKEYLKIEMHYKKPNKFFSSYGQVYLMDLVKPEFINLCKQNFFDMYQAIEKGGSMNIPDNKKELNTINLLYLALLEAGEEYGFQASEKVNQVIKQVPNDILSPNDKKSRRRQLRQAEKCLAQGQRSRFDMADLLSKELWPSPISSPTE